MRELLHQLREDQNFQTVMQELGNMRPVVPAYRPGLSLEETQAKIEEIKYQSGRQEGFDTLYRALLGK